MRRTIQKKTRSDAWKNCGITVEEQLNSVHAFLSFSVLKSQVMLATSEQSLDGY